jgi:hypothetical protein
MGGGVGVGWWGEGGGGGGEMEFESSLIPLLGISLPWVFFSGNGNKLGKQCEDDSKIEIPCTALLSVSCESMLNLALFPS